MQLNFKVIGGRSVTRTLEENQSILEVKQSLSPELGKAAVQIVLISRGLKLENKRTLGSYKIGTGATINVMISKMPVFELKLQEHFSRASGDPDLCLNEFQKRYQALLDSLNMNRIERICSQL